MPQDSVKALLLRVGIDRGTGGALAPIFADGRFEYVPIPEAEPTRSPATFATLPTRQVQSLAGFVPRRIAGQPPHIDPDFEHFTYGDAASGKRRQLLRLAPGDLLVFYAGLAPSPKDDIPRLYVIGWLRVTAAYRLTAAQVAADKELRRRFGGTAHFMRDPPDAELALVEGDARGSRFLERALPLGDGSDRLLRDLAGFGYSGSLRRSVGHWLRGSGLGALEQWLEGGPASLVGARARLVAVPADKIEAASPDRDRGDLVIADPIAAVGDWVCSLDEDGAFALARINERSGPARAAASLFWYVRRPDQELRARIPIRGSRLLSESGAADLRRFVSWLAGRYRIGVHRG